MSLIAKLIAAPRQFNLFQALRVIEAAHPEAPRLGESRRPREDSVRFGQEAELAFPPTTIDSYTPAQGGRPARLINRYFGFFGPHGPLPLHLTSHARDRKRNHRDGTFIAFADMLTHRLMSLFYRAWASGRPAPNFDRKQDPFDQKIAAFSGHLGPAFAGRDALPDLARRHFTGHLAAGPRHPEGLIAILSAYFEVPVHLQQFVGSWLELEPDDRWQLGAPARLGRTASIGTRVWSRTAKFRLIIGPLDLESYERLLPGTPAMERLTAVVRAYVGDALDWDVNLVLAGDAVPRAALGGTTRLGHTSWLRGRVREAGAADAADLYLYPKI